MMVAIFDTTLIKTSRDARFADISPTKAKGSKVIWSDKKKQTPHYSNPVKKNGGIADFTNEVRLVKSYAAVLNSFTNPVITLIIITKKMMGISIFTMAFTSIGVAIH